MSMDKKGLKILVYTQYDPTIMERIPKRFPGVFLDVFTDEDRFLMALPDADVIYVQKEFALKLSEKMAPIIAASKRLRWIQWGHTGLDTLRPLEPVWKHFLITNAKGVLAETIADYVILVIQLLHRDFQRIVKNQMNKVWERWLFSSPRGKTLGIVGLGYIGKEVARKAKFFGMKVIGLVRRPVSLDSVDSMFLPTQLREFLGQSDIVVLCVPLTQETNGLIGEESLKWMKRGSYLINVARGKIVDEKALVKALKSGHLAGAALDAFSTEPLSPDSELWPLDNVIVTPHLSGHFQDMPEKVLDLFCENLERFLEGKDLINVVDTESGY